MIITMHTDPMTMSDIQGDFILRDCAGDNCLNIHFESAESMKAYEDMEVDRGVSDLNSMSDEWYDEG